MKEEKDVIQLKNQLTEHQMSVFNSEMVTYRKNTGVAYILLILLGTVGVHKFYMGKIGMGIFYLLLGFTSWFLLVLMILEGEAGRGVTFFIFIICMGLLSINWLIDLFTIPRQIKSIYENQEMEVLHKLIGVRTPSGTRSNRVSKREYSRKTNQSRCTRCGSLISINAERCNICGKTVV